MRVIAVQAGYGQYVIDTSPDGARDALGAIQATSRDALEEMRRMLGVLRQQDVSQHPPSPGGSSAPGIHRRRRPGGGRPSAATDRVLARAAASRRRSRPAPGSPAWTG